MPKNATESIPSVSVVVAAYNAERYLVRCIDSILSQTYPDLELIIVDDGSSDGTSDLCDKYEASDKRVRVIHQKNGGQTVARQNGLKKATGEYVLIFDSDDWLELDAIEVAMKAAIENDADIVTFNGFFNYAHHRCPVVQPMPSGVFDKQGLINDVYPTMIYSGKFFLFGIFAAMWNKLFRRELIISNIMKVDPRVRIYEDGLATFPALLEAEKVCILGDAFLYNYRDNQYSITRSYCEGQFRSTIIMINALKEINRQHMHIYDMSIQIEYFFLYIIRSIMIEEFFFKHKKSLLARYMYIYSMVNYVGTRKMIKHTSYFGMTRRMKLFYFLLGLRLTMLVMIAAIIKAYLMRFKVFLRRILKRY